MIVYTFGMFDNKPNECRERHEAVEREREKKTTTKISGIQT